MNILRRYFWYHKLVDSPYRPLFRAPKLDECVSLDCETTSLDPHHARLVTIAATKIVDNKILLSQHFHVHLKAPPSLTADSIKIHHIRHQDLSSGIEEKQALEQLMNFIGNRPLVGYHIRYDKTILDLACRKHFGFPLPNPLIEISHLYHDKLERHLPNACFDLSLKAICKHLDVPIHQQHDALQDAICAALIFLRLTQGQLPSLSIPHT